jgi:hypothetical protein
MKITRIDAPQAHPVPRSILTPQGPFPRELYNEKPVVDNYEPEMPEDGSNVAIGGTAQNNFKSPKIMICSWCDEKVFANKTGNHVCKP